MTLRRVFPLTLVMMFTLIWANAISAFSASNSFPSTSRIMDTTYPLDSNQFLPTECQGRVTISMIATTSNPPQAALILGTTGNDTLNGGAGPDCIVSGAGNDTLSGGAGTTVFVGGAGTDIISGGGGTDYLYGGDGNDDLNGGTGADFLYGGNGNDILRGRGGNDLCDGGAGTDTTDGTCETVISVP